MQTLSSSRGEWPHTASSARGERTLEEIRAYWNEHIHDLAIARHPAGSREFFDELEAYRFEKLDYLPRVVDFTAYEGQALLEVGCGVGTDLLRFGRNGAVVTGIDLAEVSIDLARKNFESHGVSGDLRMMNGEKLEFDDAIKPTMTSRLWLMPAGKVDAHSLQALAQEALSGVFEQLKEIDKNMGKGLLTKEGNKILIQDEKGKETIVISTPDAGSSLYPFSVTVTVMR